MKSILFSTTSIILILALSTSPTHAASSKTNLIFEADFSNVPVPKKITQITPYIKRRATFGEWELVGKNTLKATNIPDDGHGPVLYYEMDIDNAVLTCDFKLPEKEGPDRHFRIFLDHPDYRGHTINGWANLSTKFRPTGLTLQHLQKDENKKNLVDIEFGEKSLDLQPGKWHTMQITLIDDYASIEIDGATMIEGRSDHVNTTKHKIGLNPGKAGGHIRNFRITKAPTDI